MVDKPKAKQQHVNPVTGLTDQQEVFCREYLMPQGKDARPFHGTQAALAAGYAPRSAAQQASRLLRSDKIQAYMAVLQAPAIKKFEVTQERILQELNALAFSNMDDFITRDESGQTWIDLSKCTREQMAALGGFEVIELPPFKYVEDGEEQVREVLKVKVKLWDKFPALVKLMERHNLTKPLEVNVNHKGSIDITSDDLARKVAFMLRQQREKQKAAASAAPVPPPPGTESPKPAA